MRPARAWRAFSYSANTDESFTSSNSLLETDIYKGNLTESEHFSVCNIFPSSEGSKQRGQVMSDVSNRLQGIKQTFDTAKNNLNSQLNQKVSEISQWFAEQQNSLRGQKADVAKQQSDQAYQYAVNALQNVQQQAANMQTALQSWVTSNAKSLQEAQSGLQTIANNNQPINQANLNPQSAIASAAPSYYNNSNSTDNTQKSLFNNFNWLNTG